MPDVDVYLDLMVFPPSFSSYDMIKPRQLSLTRSTEKDTLLSFPCGHIFHLNCLLGPSSPSAIQPPTPTIEPGLDNSVLPLSEPLSASRTVSTKVTHALLLKEKLAASQAAGQCDICRRKKEEGEAEEWHEGEV